MAKRCNDWFLTLPDELCLQILHYLSPRDVCRCMRVCRRLNTLCNDASLWTHVEISCRSVTSALLHNLSSTWPLLRSITLRGKRNDYRLVWEDMSREWAQFKHLESISVIECPRGMLDSFLNIIKCCPSLTSVRCESTSLKDRHLLALITSGRSLTELSLPDCFEINDTTVHFVCQTSSTVLNHLNSLQVLNLEGLIHLTDIGLLSILEACTNLKSLDIDGSMLTDRTGIYIGQHLLGLERLSISSCDHMTDDSLLSFAGLKNLRQLCLIEALHLTSRGLEMLFTQLAANKNSEQTVYPSLDTLDLTSFPKDIDSPLLVLGQKFPGLRHLDLSSCSKLTAAGLNALAQHCKALVTLRLAYVQCHYQPLLGTAFPQLRYLDIDSSDLLDDGEVQQLKRARPWLEIGQWTLWPSSIPLI